MNEKIAARQFLNTSELYSMGFSYYKICQMENKGILKKINRCTFENQNYYGYENDYLTAQAFVPFGVVCLTSAARYYNLTNDLPNAIDIAILRSKKVSTLPTLPKLKIYYFSSDRMNIGIEKINIEGKYFHIFNIHKTMADILSYRNKIGIEETSEILKNYLHHKDANINLLYSYAEKLHCKNILRTYMEVLQ